MRKILILSLFFFLNIVFSQETIIFKDNDGFSSVFQNLEFGNFNGTVSGILIIEKDDKNQMIFDFQGSDANLNIERDKNEIYDVSTKSYEGMTTSGRTKIKYDTYASANGFSIQLNNQWFELSAIDGSCDMILSGLDYSYYEEQQTEYLVIQFSKQLTLSNWQHILKSREGNNKVSLSDLKKQRKSVKVLPNSTLTFAINRQVTKQPIESIKQVFGNYIKHKESTDSKANKDLMSRSLKSIKSISDIDSLIVLINVWMYYDPTDYPDLNETIRILKASKPYSIEAIKHRIKNKMEWESGESAPYTDLPNLLKRIKKR